MLTQRRDFLIQIVTICRNVPTLLGTLAAGQELIDHTTGGVFDFEMERCLVNNLRSTNPKWGGPFRRACV